MFSALCLAASAAILVFVIRYRVHVHIEYTPRAATARRRREPAKPRAADTGCADVASALVNLGCAKAKAREISARVCATGPEQFDDRLRRAIQAAA